MSLLRIAISIDTVESRFKADPSAFLNIYQTEIDKIPDIERIEVLNAGIVDSGDLVINVKSDGLGSWEIMVDASLPYSEFIDTIESQVLNTIQAYEEGPI